MTICMTDHARARMQQRGICAAALGELLEAGKASPAKGGPEIIFFDKVARVRLRQRGAGVLRGRDRLQSIFAIMDAQGTVITVGHRYRRIARHQGA